MKNLEKYLVGWLAVCLMLCNSPVWAQGDAGDYSYHRWSGEG